MAKHPTGPKRGLNRFLAQMAAIVVGILAFTLPAQAAPGTSPIPMPQLFLGPLSYQQLTNTMSTNAVTIGYAGTYCSAGCTATSIPGSYFPPTAFIGLINNSSAAQTGNVTCYDNTAASGTVVYATGPLGSGQIITIPYGGIFLLTGLTCTMSVAVASSTTISVLFR